MDRMTTFVTLPVQLMALLPGNSVGRSPPMQPFMLVALLQASMSGLSSVMLSVIPSNSTMVMPTMRVILPEPYTVMTSSENTRVDS